MLSLPLVAVVGTGELAWDLVTQTQKDLEHQGALIAMVAAERMGGKPDGMSELLAEAKAQTLTGIRIVDDRGIVVATSGETLGDNLSDDEEVRAALKGNRGLAIKPREEWQTFWQMAPRLSGGAVVALLSTIVLSLFAGWRASRSLKLLASASERIAAGQLGTADTFAEAQGSRIQETALLGAMAQMTSRLRARHHRAVARRRADATRAARPLPPERARRSRSALQPRGRALAPRAAAPDWGSRW